MNNMSLAAGGTDPMAIVHLIPAGVMAGPVEVSIVVPALNEEISVGKFIEWCKEGLERAGVTGQILIIDSSTDKTPEIVLEHGGEVLRTPRRGLGRAYIDGLDYVRGKYVIMGDCDCTYDFREIGPLSSTSIRAQNLSWARASKVILKPGPCRRCIVTSALLLQPGY